jgi:hypothetical protein
MTSTWTGTGCHQSAETPDWMKQVADLVTETRSDAKPSDDLRYAGQNGGRHVLVEFKPDGTGLEIEAPLGRTDRVL